MLRKLQTHVLERSRIKPHIYRHEGRWACSFDRIGGIGKTIFEAYLYMIVSRNRFKKLHLINNFRELP